ncbi:transposase [Rhodovulum bhavnagarense]|uniref:Transposase n=1 Tax=Rhodovulum bhavnagarense TaxID=992286 RepID=A0A4R2R8L5_9RHOB|nr:transposase [Rhodovulum bhavnagarense]
MSTVRTDEFRKEAVRIALTSGLIRRQVADDLGVGLSTLNKWVNAHRDTDVVSPEDRELARENERLRRENRILKEERDILKNRSGPQPACARYKQPVLCCARRAVADGLLVGWTPLKNVAHPPRPATTPTRRW